jgi:quercetin dioxygenase-like cupin family protein
LNGKAEVIIGKERFIVKKEDAVFIPANVEHSYKTIGSEPFIFLCLIPNKEDKIEIVK